jgi:hypothetical protein
VKLDLAADLCRHFEGFSSKPYICPAGYATIGYGTVYKPGGEKVTMQDLPISKALAEEWLIHELRHTYAPGRAAGLPCGGRQRARVQRAGRLLLQPGRRPAPDVYVATRGECWRLAGRERAADALDQGWRPSAAGTGQAQGGGSGAVLRRAHPIQFAPPVVDVVPADFFAAQQALLCHETQPPVQRGAVHTRQLRQLGYRARGANQ